MKRFLTTSGVASYQERLDFDVFFVISLFIYLPPLHTLCKHIVAVKATIDKQSPRGKLWFKSTVLNFETGSACYQIEHNN